MGRSTCCPFVDDQVVAIACQWSHDDEIGTRAVQISERAGADVTLCRIRSDGRGKDQMINLIMRCVADYRKGK